MAIENFHNVSLDFALSLGAKVTVAYKTYVIRTREGDEERISEWQDPLRIFDLGPALRDQQDLDDLIAFFRTRLGPTYAFKLRDPTDYQVDSEFIGFGNGSTTIFPLVESYATGLPGDNHSAVRPIVLPDLPITVTVDGIVQAGGSYSVDDLQGLVIFVSPPSSGAVVRWSGTFQVPVHFQTTQMYASFAMYQRFDAPIVVQEVRASYPAAFQVVEAQPPDFVEALFPPTFSEGSESGPQYDAIVTVGASGVDARIGQFQAPRVCFRVEQGLRPTVDMRILLHFFHARRGRLSGFRAQDMTDCFGEHVYFGTGDGATTTFFLSRTYTSGSFQQVRLLTKPLLPIAIYADGILQNDVLVQRSLSSDVTLTAQSTPGLPPTVPVVVPETGAVVFPIPPPINSLLTWTGYFHVPVRFDTDQLTVSVDGPDAHTWADIPLLEIATILPTVTIEEP